jgi:antitoxin component YwqK of YwqJK toxin-antitoxin module
MNNQTGKIIETFFSTGEIESRGCEVNGIKVGAHRKWHKNGRLFVEAEYQGGKIHGLMQQWDDSGQLMISANFQEGLLSGEYRSWWPSGGVKEHGDYEYGSKIGKYTWYNQDGSIWKVIDFSE